ncbi:MAG: nitronate monooxygenase [Bacteroidia bacterium]|nr:nitronate monooxygenase [Bacteroidia bacterium]
MKLTTTLTNLFEIEFPLVMAPMFLVSNEDMIKAAVSNGIAGVIPSLNYRNDGELEVVLSRLNDFKNKTGRGTYGVNLIVQNSNPFYKKHLDICIKYHVPFYITSLGNPSEVIQKAHAYGARVFCDVTNIRHAKKCHNAGCDGFIAVGQGAGGHAGPYPLQVLIPALKKEFPDKPILAAGGISTGNGILSALYLGAAGVSMGTRFIACKECNVSDEYKNAIVQSRMEDIVMTEKISGTPNSIINTPFAKKIGYKQNWLEKFITQYKSAKKQHKNLIRQKWIKLLEQSVIPGNYQNLWIAGQSVELIDNIKSCDEIITDLKNEVFTAIAELKNKFTE